MSLQAMRAMFVIGGLGFMAYGVWAVVRGCRLRRDGVSVQGRVVRVALSVNVR